MDRDGLGLGFGSEQGLIGPGEIGEKPGLGLVFGSEQGLIGPGEIGAEPGLELDWNSLELGFGTE